MDTLLDKHKEILLAKIKKASCPREEGKIKKHTCADPEIQDGVLTTQPCVVLNQCGMQK
jgi:hypothetical protein